MSSVGDKLLALTRQLFPTGRAFRVGYGSTKEKVLTALTKSEARYHADALKILNSILPDNDGFTVDDATLWEHRLGMITNPLVSLSDRKTAIIRKMQHPGNILARQSAGYLEDQLQLAGFNVFVYENIPVQTIENLIIDNLGPDQLGDFQLGDQQLGDVYSVNSDLFDAVQLGDSQLGDFQLGQYEYNNKIANSITRASDVFFNFGTYRRTFFIGGATLGQFADVDSEREAEFRQLILKCKPTQTVGFLLIQYV